LDFWGLYVANQLAQRSKGGTEFLREELRLFRLVAFHSSAVAPSTPLKFFELTRDLDVRPLMKSAAVLLHG
jgi:hypothetical protein